MAERACGSYDELHSTLIILSRILHSTLASMEFFSDKNAPIEMLHVAKNLTEKAQGLAGSLYRHCKERKAPSSQTGQGQ